MKGEGVIPYITAQDALDKYHIRLCVVVVWKLTEEDLTRLNLLVDAGCSSIGQSVFDTNVVSDGPVVASPDTVSSPI